MEAWTAAKGALEEAAKKVTGKIEGTNKLPGLGPKSNHQVKKSWSNSKSKEKIQAMSWGPAANDPRLGVVDQAGAAMVWNTLTGKRMAGTVRAGFAQCIAISEATGPDMMILTGGMRNATSMFKMGAGPIMEETKTWIKHDGYISSLHFLGPNKYISSSGDADIRVFDITADPKGSSLQVLRGHKGDAQSIKFPRDDAAKNTFITCSSDMTVKMWDLRVGCAVGSYKTESELNSCSIFPDGKLIACGGQKDKTYVFDVRAHKQAGVYCRNNMITASCEFSKSGRELYVGHEDGAIVVWDIFSSGENKKYAQKIVAHTTYEDEKKTRVDTTKSRVQALEVGPYGYLASGGFDGSVKIWGPAP